MEPGDVVYFQWRRNRTTDGAGRLWGLGYIDRFLRLRCDDHLFWLLPCTDINIEVIVSYNNQKKE